MKAIILALVLSFGFSSFSQEKEYKVVTTKQTTEGIPMKKREIVVVDKKPTVAKKVHKHRHHKKHFHKGKECRVVHKKKSIFQK